MFSVTVLLCFIATSVIIVRLQCYGSEYEYSLRFAAARGLASGVDDVFFWPFVCFRI